MHFNYVKYNQSCYLPKAAIAFWICLKVNPISKSGAATEGGGGSGVRGGDGEWLWVLGGKGADWGVKGPSAPTPLGGLWWVDEVEAQEEGLGPRISGAAGAQGIVIGSPKEGMLRPPPEADDDPGKQEEEVKSKTRLWGRSEEFSPLLWNKKIS